MTDFAASRLAPQQINPTPMGTVPGMVLGIEEDWCAEMHSERVWGRDERSVPEPKNPMPPARETLVASAGPAIMRKGADAMRSVAVQGYWDLRFRVREAILGLLEGANY